MSMGARTLLRSNPVAYKAHGIVKYGLFRANLLLTEWRDRNAPKAEGDLPIPPAMLRYRVGGSFDREVFLGIGAGCAVDLQKLAVLGGKDLVHCGPVLDFACGCGRVIRHFKDHAPGFQWHGSDIDPEAIKWCRENLGSVASFGTNGFQPPTSFEDDMFEVIYSVSLFTHLNEQDQFKWLRELARIVRKDGIVIASVHGPFTHEQLPPEDASKVRADGFLYRVGQTGKLKLDGLPDFYQTAYTTEKYIRERWSEFFEVVAYEERAMSGYQDAVVLRKRAA
jgi:SAM-dependent methyltransferase